MQAKNNLILNEINSQNEQNSDSFPRKLNEDNLETTVKVIGITLVKKASNRSLDDTLKAKKLENNSENFNYLFSDNEDNLSENKEDNSLFSEKIKINFNCISDIRQNDYEEHQRFLSRKTVRKKSDDYSFLQKTKKNLSEKKNDSSKK